MENKITYPAKINVPYTDIRKIVHDFYVVGDLHYHVVTIKSDKAAKNLHSALGELLNIPDEISRLKALLISEKRKYLQRFEDDSYEGRKTTRQSLESFINQHNLK